MFSSSQLFASAPEASQPMDTQPMDTQAKPARQEEKQTCVPTTLRAIQNAAKAGDSEFRLYGSELAFVVVVGVVEKLVQQAVGVQFVLNDATGRVAVKSFAEQTVTLTEGTYVEVVAAVRSAPELHLSAQWMRLVPSADEVSYHMIAAAHAALKLQRGPAQVPTPLKTKRAVAEAPATSVDVVMESPPKEQRPADASMGVAPETKAKGTTDLRSSIVAALQKTTDMAGANISSIAKQLSASDSDVRGVLDMLVEEGEAYTTLDENHFALL